MYTVTATYFPEFPDALLGAWRFGNLYPERRVPLNLTLLHLAITYYTAVVYNSIFPVNWGLMIWTVLAVVRE